MSEDLWGDLPEVPDIVTPYAILLEQAETLTRKTKGIIIGKVMRGNTVGDEFENSLMMIVPSLNNYTYVVAEVVHSISLYPARLRDAQTGMGGEVANEKELKEGLRRLLSSEQVRNVLKGILAQVDTGGGARRS
jgi:hypothetical protein